MVIYPAIDIKERECVRLVQGSYDDVTVYERDPVLVAKRWEDLGAKALHLVDLDGAKDGLRMNEAIVKAIARSVKVPVQVGGGIRDTEGVKTYLGEGVSQVIIGTAAIRNPDWLRAILQAYGDRIIVSVDAKDGLIATDGWKNTSNVKARDLIRDLKAIGLRRVVYTDIAKDGMLIGPNFQMYEELKKEVDIEIIASGGVTTKEDILRLREIGVYGAIIGKALYEGRLDLEEVLTW